MSNGLTITIHKSVSTLYAIQAVIFENNLLRATYGVSNYIQDQPEHCITEFMLINIGVNQAGGFCIDSAFKRGYLLSAETTVETADMMTAHMVWENGEMNVSIFKDQPFLRLDYLSWNVNYQDTGHPGGSKGLENRFEREYAIYGADQWPKGAVIGEEEMVFYDRYLGDVGQFGLTQPDVIDGGALNYHGYFILGMFNRLNNQGYGRVMPVNTSDIVKLWDDDGGSGWEVFPLYDGPIHKPFSTFLFAVSGGKDELMMLGKRIADLHQEQLNS